MNNHLTKLFGALLFSGVMSAYATSLAQIPQTGQTIGYGAGSDGALQKCSTGTNTTGRFVLGSKADGSACPAGEEIESDLQTGLSWVKSPPSTTYTWANAIITNATSGGAIPASYCGYTDWRLPNRNELYSLINYGQLSQAPWLIAQGFTNVQVLSYWSSTTYARDATSAWFVNLGVGSVGVYTKIVPNYVWPVRGGQ
jgi:hypothetical protein